MNERFKRWHEQLEFGLYDQEIERCVVGAFLFGETDERVKASHFYSKFHRECFEVICENEQCDAVLLKKNLERRGCVVWVQEIMDIMETLPNAKHLPHYVDKLIDLYRRRRMLKAAAFLEHNAFDLTSDVDDVWGKVTGTQL